MINVLVSSFRCIWIPVLWVYTALYMCYSFSGGIDYGRQILTFKVGPRTERVDIMYTLTRQCITSCFFKYGSEMFSCLKISSRSVHKLLKYRLRPSDLFKLKIYRQSEEKVLNAKL